ncbi:MAG: hypothetical protein NXI04_21805 [Planctomycetaceae bacterium]|nr:hypothetical protein [Planctomycetaceae bacterium]
MAILTLVVSVGGQAPAMGQVESAVARDSQEATEAAQLIQQLAASEYSKRIAAQKRLGQLGEAAIAPVKAALETSSGEQRIRLKSVLRQLEAASFDGRLAALQKSQSPSDAVKLPEWARFEALFGSSRQSVKLYERLIIAETELFRIADRSVPSLRTTLQIRAEELVDDKQKKRLSVDSVAAILFLASNNEIILRSNTSTNVTDCIHGDFEKALNGKDGDSLLKLVGQWILRKPISVSRPLKFARQYRMPEGLQLARRTLRGPVRKGEGAEAMMLIKEQGTRDDIEVLESLFDPRHPEYNKTGGEGVVFRGRRLNDQYVCLNADLALSLAIAMRGGHPFDFGFRADRRNAPPAQFAFTEASAGFISNAERAAALAAYRKAYNR